jgi:hypothetical protein
MDTEFAALLVGGGAETEVIDTGNFIADRIKAPCGIRVNL